MKALITGMLRDKTGKFVGGEGFWKGKTRPHTEASKLKISEGVKRSGHKPPITTYWLGKNRKGMHTAETRLKLSEMHRGALSHLWRGGVTPEHQKIRTSAEYKIWRDEVFKRDNYTCVLCGKRGVRLNADHIKSFALFPELRFIVSNGRTLCVPCHKLTPTYLNRWYV
jgi:NUMOD3 motif